MPPARKAYFHFHFLFNKHHKQNNKTEWQPQSQILEQSDAVTDLRADNENLSQLLSRYVGGMETTQNDAKCANVSWKDRAGVD